MSKVKNVVRKYIQRRINDEKLIIADPSDDLEIIIVVPAFKESLEDLLSLCKSLDPQETTIRYELIIVLNNPISDKQAYQINNLVWNSKDQFENYSFPVHFINKMNLPDSKKVGVGNARKIGMDQGLMRFDDLSKQGIILCLDADCIVAPNYIQEVYNTFAQNPKAQALSIGFEHRINELENREAKIAIIEYELHLRYYIHIQLWVGLPFAFQTVGSAMAVRSHAYAAEGGMPVLQAGEDFYFLHKFICKNSCINIRKSLVFPSGRISDRVPFGTGRAVGEILSSDESYKTYNPKSFVVLKKDLEIILNSYPIFEDIENQIGQESLAFFKTVSFKKKIIECHENTTNKQSFEKRFFQWFDAFLLMKYLHFLRDMFFPDINLLNAVNTFEEMKGSNLIFNSKEKALNYYQILDASGGLL